MLSAAFLAGCARFTPLPLPDRTELPAPTDMARIRMAANRIAHPLLPPIHFDERDGLSPDEAAVLAVLLNPRLRVARDDRRIAAAQLLQAGLLPIAIGHNVGSRIFQPFAVAVIGGLLSATLTTLILVPVFLSFVPTPGRPGARS